MLTITRVDESGGEDDFTYSYSGNQLTSSTYDSNGNMTYDASSGLNVEWNDLNLIKKVSDGNGVLVNYTYLADGTKIRAVAADGEGLEYRGSLTFRRSSDGTLTPESIAFPGGRFVAMQGADGSIQMVPNYHIADHLGSVRTIIDGSTGQVVETNDYYAFGSRWDRSGSLIDQSNRYRYNGKEEQVTFGTPYSDYGARQYSAASGRWLTMDPLAEQAYDLTPYVFCSNNPVNNYDPNGKWDIKVSAIDDRGRAPYAVMTVTSRSGETIYKTVVRVTGKHRDRTKKFGDTPVGKYKILEWRRTGEGSGYSADSYGPNDLLALYYMEGEGKDADRSGMDLHGGRSQVELRDTEGSIRIADEDIAELKELTEALEASDPEERKGMLFVENDLIDKVVYQDRESIKYDWERHLGELPAAVVTPNN